MGSADPICSGGPMRLAPRAQGASARHTAIAWTPQTPGHESCRQYDSWGPEARRRPRRPTLWRRLGSKSRAPRTLATTWVVATPRVCGHHIARYMGRGDPMESGDPSGSARCAAGAPARRRGRFAVVIATNIRETLDRAVLDRIAPRPGERRSIDMRVRRMPRASGVPAARQRRVVVVVVAEVW